MRGAQACCCFRLDGVWKKPPSMILNDISILELFTHRKHNEFHGLYGLMSQRPGRSTHKKLELKIGIRFLPLHGSS